MNEWTIVCTYISVYIHIYEGKREREKHPKIIWLEHLISLSCIQFSLECDVIKMMT